MREVAFVGVETLENKLIDIPKQDLRSREKKSRALEAPVIRLSEIPGQDRYLIDIRYTIPTCPTIPRHRISVLESSVPRGRYVCFRL